MNRREFLQAASLSTLGAGLSSISDAWASAPVAPGASMPEPAAATGTADYTLRIATGILELAPNRFVSTTLYNGDFPGPLVRATEGRPVTIDIFNDTDGAEQVNWHGQELPASVDGADEEGTPPVPAHGHKREVFLPSPTGLRMYHSLVRAGADLSRGLYSGQAGPVFIEPAHFAGDYDQEVFLTLKEFQPYLNRVDDDTPFMAPTGMELPLVALAAKADPGAGAVPPGYELAYGSFAINGKSLGFGEPIRVRPGARVMLHVVNASATENRSLALPGHVFKVVALDGNPVPHPAAVPVLWLGAAERVSAIVEMRNPGVWVLGDTADADREAGMGIVVEYAGATGQPRWQAPPKFMWDYRLFADPTRRIAPPDEVIDLVITMRQSAAAGFDLYAINGVPYDWRTMPVTRQLRLGRRYRFRLRNASGDIHPLHFLRHTFELTRLHGTPTAGVLKDVVLVPPFQTTEIDFTAAQPGRAVFCCHMQQHMDHGFMAVFDTV